MNTTATDTRLVQPYLMFDGCCEEALEFYKKALCAEVTMLLRYKDNPEPPSSSCPSVPLDKVMHAQLRIGETVVMASDGHCAGHPDFKGFCLSLTVPTETAAKQTFQGLSAGGKVTMPLEKTFFSPCFGMLTDRFGVGWMILTR